MREKILDDFEDLSTWLPVASGLAELAIVRESALSGGAMRLEFDFKGGGGFVVARRPVELRVPETYAFLFDIRGEGPSNNFEFKLSDPSGKNVWWYHHNAFELPRDWRPFEIRSSDIEFAWGPASGERMSAIGAIEIAIAAGPGGNGHVSIANLRLEDRTVYATPLASASSEVSGSAAANVLDGSADSMWRSRSGVGEWLVIDFQARREYGGLIITWAPGGRARHFGVAVSDDAVEWTIVHESVQADAARSFVYLPATTSRFVRLDLAESVAGSFGITTVEVQAFEFSRSIDAFFRHVAAAQPRGAYPKYVYREQTYWSPVGVADGHTCALLNEEGMVEVDKGEFSLAPFLFEDGRLVSWADAEISQTLDAGYLPVPSSVWIRDGLELHTTAFAWRSGEAPVLYIRYGVRNTGRTERRVALFAAIYPFQVTPPWQAFESVGGVKRIREISYEKGVARVNGERVVASLTAPSAFGAAAFEQGAIAEHLAEGALPSSTTVKDSFGFASGAFRYDLTVRGGDVEAVWIAVPFGACFDDGPALHARLGGPDEASRAFAAALLGWDQKLTPFELRLPAAAREHADTLRTATAHILIDRDGPALQPGPRRYTRAWIRDGAIMAAALLRMGCGAEAKDFTRWYAGFQAPDGNVPCAVDHKGPDWLVEHDSHGQLIFAVEECYRFTHDRAFISELWPAVRKAVDYIDVLRATRLTSEYDTDEKRARRGLLPESASHEGYLAHPVHAYWDDFWALRGLSDAAALARRLGHESEAVRAASLAAALEDSLYASITLTMKERSIQYVPGSVEWADFDPTATSNAITLLDQLRNLPRAALERTFDEYLTGFRRRRRNEIDWANYTPYEVRIVGALIRLGWREQGNELLDFLLSDRRPLRWNQWPEIAWRDPKSPGHIGDVPHTWIGAEYVLACLSLFAFERLAERELVIAAGVPPAWLESPEGVEVKGLPTYYGALSYTLRRTVDGLELHLSLHGDSENEAPKIVVSPPLTAPLVSVEVNGRHHEAFTDSECVLAEWPCEVLMRC